MKDFNFISPTKIYFGKDKEKEIGKIIKEYNFKKVFFHYGQSSIKRSGLYEVVVNSLKENEIDFIELGGVLPNPDISLCKEGIKLCREHNCDFILAVGGGSVIDSAKMIAHGVYYPNDPFDIPTKKYVSNKALPLGVILTNSASGSELSSSCVISCRERNLKRGFNTDLNRPVFVVENPELTYSLDLFTTGCGVVDILSHTFERYFCHSEENEFSDYLAEGLMRNVIDNGIILSKDLSSYQARANMMIASSYSHNWITSLGKDFRMPIHQLEHELSGLFPRIAHGEGLAILIPAWMEVCYKLDKDKFVKFSENVMLVDKNLDDEDKIIQGIRKLKEFFHLFNLKTDFDGYNITSDDIITMVNSLTDNKKKIFDSNIPLDYTLAEKVYRKCLGE
jgi:alcohol dehydrogenase YqhD (iron-dependent ADH family)